MKKLINGVILFFLLGSTTGCHHFFNDHDINPPAPPILPDIATDYIGENYPEFVIQSVEFEDICDDNIVLEVELEDGPGPDVDLYFTVDGEFLFAEYDIEVSDLPMAVIETIESEFGAGYHIDGDHVDVQELPDGSVQYEVKLEQASGSDVEVVFSENGEIICQDNSGDDDSGNDDNDGNDDNNDDSIDPANLPSSIMDYINANYAGYTQMSAELEDPCGHSSAYEVELEDGPGPDVDLYFTLDGEFLFGEYDISVGDLPMAVMAAIESEFAGYNIDADDLERQELPDGSIQYEVKLEQAGGSDVEVVFSESGEILCQDTSGNDDNNDDDDSNDDNNDNPGNLPTAIMDYINANYSGYTQQSVEFEDPCGHSNVYEVELEDGPGPDVDLYFSLDGEFLFAGSEVSSDDLPDTIMAVIESNYAAYELDEDKVERFDMADGSVRYSVELESNSGSDLEIVFNEDGSVACIDD